MVKHAEGVRSQPESTLILTLTPRQTTLLRSPLTRTPALLRPILLPTHQRSLRALESRMLLWDGNDASLPDCVNLGVAVERRMRRWLAGGR